VETNWCARTRGCAVCEVVILDGPGGPTSVTGECSMAARTGGRIPQDRSAGEADLSAEHPETGQEPWIPPSHVDPGRSSHHRRAPTQGAPPAVRLTGRQEQSGDRRSGPRSGHLRVAASARPSKPGRRDHANLAPKRRTRPGSSAGGLRRGPERRFRSPPQSGAPSVASGGGRGGTPHGGGHVPGGGERTSG
jgi:hypothetical protein